MYRVTVDAGNLRFSAAHFITFAGKCERLHGHNYAVTATLEGDLSEDRYVFDFVELKHIVKELCDHYDHRFLLPRQSGILRFQATEDEVEISFRDRRYVFPKQDVLELPLDNITAERLAEHMAGELAARVAGRGNIAFVEVGVEESPGQTAFCRKDLRTPGNAQG